MGETRDLPPFAARAVGVVVAVQAVVLTALSGRYGFHRDELYFLAAGDRPDWGYVDQPPITPLLARLSTAVFGDTPTGLRVVATLLGAATVVVVALVARELGGGRDAQVFAAVATALSAYAVVVSHMLTTNSVDMLLWALVGLFALRLFRTGDGRWWLAVGAAVGVGMANKWLILVLVLAIGVSLLVLGPRSVLRTWWLAAGVGVALVVAAPVLVWQAAHDFPLLTVASGISQDDGAESRILFVPMQLVYVSPVLVPVWVAGIVRLFRDPDARALALAYPVLCVVLLVLGGKPYYSIPLLVLMTAAGAEPTSRWLARGGRGRRVGAGVAAVVGALVSTVVGLPLLPAAALGPVVAMNAEQGEQVGWHEFATTVADVWDRIPAADRDRAVIFAGNFGEAGAIERFHAELGVPVPYSGHMSYADWGPPADSMSGPVVLVGVDPGRDFTGCERVTEIDIGYDWDNDEVGTDVWLCDGPARPWSRLWPDLRRYY
ncbi:glycosyltransferase family 39 protein [Actinophytocola oryzae]|uniref:Dolichyl-phosphate-mannose-protein mannosyltransferase n=1 Tax=Actinophytocola oryzae TaxID=502181 RepID=A0A4R7VZ10_9PSEU|nr:glycosyltransferase family 39 protein [Actinophytocola oryzae]TDV55430.1 dolichyl-phosphate-mannose-protein mannosyltransferase [Actinophytocola oryzae]